MGNPAEKETWVRVVKYTSDTRSVVEISCGLVNWSQKGFFFLNDATQNIRIHTVVSDPHTTHQPNGGKWWHRVASLSIPLSISSGNHPWSAAPAGLWSFSWDVKQETGCGTLCDVTSYWGCLWMQQFSSVLWFCTLLCHYSELTWLSAITLWQHNGHVQ